MIEYLDLYSLPPCPKATVVSDILVLYILKSRDYYRHKKILNVTDPPAENYEIINDSDTEDPQETVRKHYMS